ncbi:cell division protein FtsQ/DivIB [Cellulomonas sp. WB94]|uniref:cell division protein FtsQ/DivIB n=1 Tax=Cellulomonas sp. WB94 TaxID=2173174 RepID=UPI001F5BD926|nr:cell division protein FtsQ/DivIB [Cellulomonas sp. WB94]
MTPLRTPPGGAGSAPRTGATPSAGRGTPAAGHRKSVGNARGAGRGAGPGRDIAALLEPSVTTYAAGRGGGVVPVRPSVVSTGSAARFAERARARRTIARRQVLGVGGGLVGLAAVGWLLFVSPVLALDPLDVTVTGAGTVVAVDQVAAVVAARASTPLPRLDTVGLRDAILEVPGVREARVTRDWPHGIVVELVAREPVAAVPETAPADPTAPAAGFALLDMDGVQVGRVDAAPDGLPVVEVPVGDKRTLAAVLSVLQALPADLLAEVGQVSAQTQDTVTMQLRDGARVEWGSAQQAPLKIAVLQALRKAPSSAGAQVYDVSAPTLPVTK